MPLQWGRRMTPQLSVIQGAGATVDRAAALCEAIQEAVYEHGAGLSLAAVIGALEIAKMEVLRDHEE